MTDRTIWRRIADRYRQARYLVAETALDLRDIVKHDYRGGAVLMIVAFWAGVFLKGCVG